MGLIIILGLLVFALALYVFICYCLKRICQKCGEDPGILIWIPIAQLVPLLKIAKMDLWMIILFFIPIVNIVIGVMMWAKICTARGKSPWLVILMFIPMLILMFIILIVLSVVMYCTQVFVLQCVD